MRFYPTDAQVPDTLVTPVFVLRPLTPAHVEIDYEAVMGSRHMLRVWSGSGPGGWPADDFTIAGNLQDLERHDQEHRERVAFTYTVLDPTETVCLGCVYITPLASLLESNRDALAHMGDDEAMVSLWIVSSQLEAGLDGRLLVVLIDWLRTAWQFQRVYFRVHEGNTQQQALLARAGMQVHYRLNLPRGTSRHFLYQLPEAGDDAFSKPDSRVT